MATEPSRKISMGIGSEEALETGMGMRKISILEMGNLGQVQPTSTISREEHINEHLQANVSDSIQ